MKQVRFLDEAREELLSQVAYYEERQKGLGERFRLAVKAASALAATHPKLGSPWKLRTRRVFPKGFPFSVVYRIEPTELVVFAIAHFSQRPTYWRGRSDGLPVERTFQGPLRAFGPPLMSLATKMDAVANRLQFWPSRRTVFQLCAAWLVVAGATLWYLLPKFTCANEFLLCESVAVLLFASAAYGLAFAAFYVALAVLLSPVVQRLRPQIRVLEPAKKVLPVVATHFAIQVAVLGCVSAAGALPPTWPWWLGVLGAFWS